MIHAIAPRCECGGRMIRNPRAGGIAGYILECAECSVIKIYNGEGIELDLADERMRPKKRQGAVVNGDGMAPRVKYDRPCKCDGCAARGGWDEHCCPHRQRLAVVTRHFPDLDVAAWEAAGGPGVREWAKGVGK